MVKKEERTYTLEYQENKGSNGKSKKPIGSSFLFLFRKYHMNGPEIDLLPKIIRDDTPQSTNSKK